MDWSERWVEGIERRRRAILGVAALLVVVSALSIARLQLDFDVLSQVPSSTPRTRFS